MIKKRAQEEMVGFALIIVIVGVILLVFLAITLNRDSTTELESYEVENFIQAFLQYTTTCEISSEYLSVQDLVFECNDNEVCKDGENTCDILNDTLISLVESGWAIGPERVYKGYELTIQTSNEEMPVLMGINRGNVTNAYKGSVQDFAKRREEYAIIFKAYY